MLVISVDFILESPEAVAHQEISFYDIILL